MSLAPGEAAHETRPTEEPEETNESHEGQNRRGKQEELEERGSSDGCSILESSQLAQVFTVGKRVGMAYSDAERVEVIARDSNDKESVREEPRHN